MDNKHKLTEELKVLETEIYDAKIDLRAINRKLNMAYQYEEALNIRMSAAKERTEELRNEFFKKSSVISNFYNKMKNIFDIFTDNYYRGD